MSKRLSLALIVGAFFAGVVVGALWYKFRLFPFPQLYSLTQKQAFSTSVIEDEGDYYVPDSIVGHVHKARAVRQFKWKEHPAGSITMAANNLGLREDQDTLVKKGDNTFRILVTGDSHIDGAVNNNESFPNRLEAMLNAHRGSLSFEVVNGGTGHYGPHNYHGFLQKFLELKPDMFIVVLYTGNDFVDAIRTAEIRRELSVPKRPDDYNQRLRDADSHNRGAVQQGLNQSFFFRTFPQFESKAVQIAYQQIVEISSICKQRGIKLLVLTLPTYADLAGGSLQETFIQANQRLGLNALQQDINRRMGRSLIMKLSAASVSTLDPFDKMRESSTPLFWEADYHLNHLGHDLLAKIVHDYLKATRSISQETSTKPDS